VNCASRFLKLAAKGKPLRRGPANGVIHRIASQWLALRGVAQREFPTVQQKWIA
jgi:hypothetical protein